MSKWDDTVTIRFIKLYKDHECLWARQKNEATISRRATAWCIIAKEVSKLLKQPVTVMDCKQKMKCLWQKFRREKLKVMSEKGGDGISDWPFYGELTFLQNIIATLKKKRKSPMPMLRSKRRTRMIQRYGRSATNETLNKERENIVATPKCEVKETAKGPRNKISTERKRKVMENVHQTLRCSKVAEPNTTENGKYSLMTSAKRIKLTEMKKRPKYLNVNVIHNSTPEVQRNPLTPVSVTPFDSYHTFAQDECQCFGSYVANKTRSYTAYTRSAVHHAISEILLKADMGYYNNVKSSATVNTQTDATELNVQQCPNTMQLSYVVKSEDLSDLDDDSITALTTSRSDHVPIQ